MISSVKMEYTELAQEDKEQTSSEQASKCAREDVCREDKKKFKLYWPFIFLISAALLISVALLIISLTVLCILVLKINTQTLEIATLKENYTTLEKLVANEQKIQLDKITEQIEEMNETWTERVAFETAIARNETLLQKLMVVDLKELVTTTMLTQNNVMHEIKELQQSMRVLNKSLEEQQAEITQLAKKVKSSSAALFLQLGVTRENITSMSKLISGHYNEIRANFSAAERDITSAASLIKALAETSKAIINDYFEQLEQIRARLSTMNSTVPRLIIDIHKLRVETRSNISELSERSSHSLQQFQEQLSSNASKLGEIVMAVDRIKANTSKADKQIQDNMRSLFAIQTSQKSIGDSLDRLQGEVYFLDFSMVANQSLLKSKVNSQGQKMRSLETSVVAKQTSQRSKDNSQDEEINELSYEVHRLMSSAYQHNSSTLTTIVCCVVYIIVTAY